MIVRSNALALPLRDGCVDLVVTSPPYFALRSYQDDGGHYGGQLGSEETPGAFVDALVEATAEMARVLKPTGSIFVNLGDKYAGSGGHNNAELVRAKNPENKNRPGGSTIERLLRDAPKRYNQNSGGIPAKSLMGLPWRYANAVVDQLGLILRRDQIWHKPNGLPESVTDRCRSDHEYWFHFVKQGRYFSAIDEIREPQMHSLDRTGHSRGGKYNGDLPAEEVGDASRFRSSERTLNPLGKLPGSVWTIASEPLVVPDWAKEQYNLPDHFAAFPQEWPRRLILGWSPSGICTKCGEGRRPVVEKEFVLNHTQNRTRGFTLPNDDGSGGPARVMGAGTDLPVGSTDARITGYACACDVPIAKTRPAVVLDPFGGTGTVVMVARALGRVGFNGDLSGDYCRLARWRIYHSGHAAKSEQRTWRDAQGVML